MMYIVHYDVIKRIMSFNGDHPAKYPLTSDICLPILPLQKSKFLSIIIQSIQFNLYVKKSRMTKDCYIR